MNLNEIFNIIKTRKVLIYINAKYELSQLRKDHIDISNGINKTSYILPHSDFYYEIGDIKLIPMRNGQNGIYQVLKYNEYSALSDDFGTYNIHLSLIGIDGEPKFSDMSYDEYVKSRINSKILFYQNENPKNVNITKEIDMCKMILILLNNQIISN